MPIRNRLYNTLKEKGSAVYEKTDRKALQLEVDETNDGKDIGLNNGRRRVTKE